MGNTLKVQVYIQGTVVGESSSGVRAKSGFIDIISDLSQRRTYHTMGCFSPLFYCPLQPDARNKQVAEDAAGLVERSQIFSQP